MQTNCGELVFKHKHNKTTDCVLLRFHTINCKQQVPYPCFLWKHTKQTMRNINCNKTQILQMCIWNKQTNINYNIYKRNDWLNKQHFVCILSMIKYYNTVCWEVMIFVCSHVTQLWPLLYLICVCEAQLSYTSRVINNMLRN